ncbi:hypothetical protein D1872_114700 [compost metagenome]
MNKKSISLLSAMALSMALAGCSGGELPTAASAEQTAIAVEVGKVIRGSIGD